MKINSEHLNHGAALAQIAEHPQFTAINSFRRGGKPSRCAYRINDSIGVYLKFATKPKPPFREYQFTFHLDHLKELKSLGRKCTKVFVVLVCVKDSQICCLPVDEVIKLVAARQKANPRKESQYTILVTLKSGQAFRAYMNKPGVKKTYLMSPMKVPRNRFPGILFV